MRRIAIVIAAILASISLQSQAQNLDRRSQLISPPSGQADPGDTVMDLRITSALPNAFGGADIFGRRVDAGQVVVQYLGMRDGAVVFVRQSNVVNSNENTMNRTPMILNGQLIMPPSPSPPSGMDLTPVQILTLPGGHIRVEGKTLTVLRANDDGSIQFVVSD